MAILSRITRLCRADLHGVMDQIEDSDLLLKQYLREMEQALAEKNVRLNRMKQHRNRLRHEHKRRAGQIEGLDQDVTAAIYKSKDDIARMLIRKLRGLTGLRDEIAHSIQGLDLDIQQLREICANQQLQFDQLKLKATAHFDQAARQKWDNDPLCQGLSDPADEPSLEEVELELIKRKEALEHSSNRTS